MIRSPRKENPKHLAFIRQLPCIVCGDNTSTEAAHIRYADRSVCKRQAGMGEKADDAFTVPLCGHCHRWQHTANERAFWISKGIDPIRAALALHYHSGDADACSMILQATHDNALAGD